MDGVVRGLCALVVVVAAVGTAGSAAAESRLFTARTSQPGVTIVQAMRNGQQLPVAGQNGADTFFRIDNPGGAVPCSNRIQFTASNGESVDAPVDLCANNWQVTVAVGAAGGIPGGGGRSVPGGSQPLVITTDDPSVTITNVFLLGQEVPIAARQDPYVEINLLGSPQGFECSRDLGLALSDGRRIARLVDVCQTNFFVVVALVGGPRPPAPPAGFAPAATIQPLPPAGAIQPLPQLTAPPPAPMPQVVGTMQWMFAAFPNRASFAYGLPNSDASEFTAVCQAQSSQVTVTLTRSADELAPGSGVAVRLAAGAFASTYTATGSVVSEIDGLSHPVLQIATSDPLWPAMIRESVLSIAIGSSPPFAISLSGSAAKARQFLAVCNPPPPVQPPLVEAPVGPALGNGATAVGFACDDGSYINVAFDDSTAVVYEPGAPPVVLMAAPSAGEGPRYLAGRSELVGEGDQVFWTRDGGYARTCTGR